MSAQMAKKKLLPRTVMWLSVLPVRFSNPFTYTALLVILAVPLSCGADYGSGLGMSMDKLEKSGSQQDVGYQLKMKGFEGNDDKIDEGTRVGWELVTLKLCVYW